MLCITKKMLVFQRNRMAFGGVVSFAGGGGGERGEDEVVAAAPPAFAFGVAVGCCFGAAPRDISQIVMALGCREGG